MLRLLQHPAVLLLLCFSLVGTPVTYRGGASNPHPHTFIEFLMEAESGKFDHHHHGDADESGDDDAPEHRHETASRAPAHPASAPASQQADAPEQFRASISAFVVSDVGQLAFILPNSALPQSTQIDTAFAQGNRILSGISHTPTAPPPR